jgi:hypothetical protein
MERCIPADMKLSDILHLEEAGSALFMLQDILSLIIGTSVVIPPGDGPYKCGLNSYFVYQASPTRGASSVLPGYMDI